MTNLQIVQGVETPDGALAADIRDLRVVQTANGPLVISTTGINGGLVSYQLSSGQGAQTYQTTSFLPGDALNLTGEISILSQGDQDILIIGNSSTGSFGYVLNPNGSFGEMVEISGLGVAGELSALHDSSTGVVFLAEYGGNGIGIYSQNTTGTYSQTATLQDTEESHLTDVVCLAGGDMADGRIVLAASRGEGGITSYCLDTDTGEVKHLDSLGVQDGFGFLPEIVGLETVSAYGATFAITATSAPEFGAGALSVARIGPDGALIAMDHVLDTLSTRFGQVQSMSTVTAGDRTYVLAGGGDDGVTLFLLMPNGRLLHLDSFAHSNDVALQNLSAVAATQIGDEVQVLAASSTTAGLTQLSFSVAEHGYTLIGDTLGGDLVGGGADDLLSGGSGNELILGNDGDDTLVDGAGEDTLIGGGGFDLFVLDQDGAQDRIENFDKRYDTIDLSAFSMLYDPNALEIESTAQGALIHWRGETTEVLRKGGGSLSRSDILATITTGPDRPPLVVGRDWQGSNANDVLSGEWGNDTLNGGKGRDYLSGGIGDDDLIGGQMSDTLIGGAGNDTIYGGRGRDWVEMGDGDDLYNDSKQGNTKGRDRVEAGAGNDTIRGRGGDDTFFGDEGNDEISGGGGKDKIRGGAGNDTLMGNIAKDKLYGETGDDLLYGGDGNDSLYGGDGDDVIRGGKGADSFVAGRGNDVIYGGNGRDTGDLGWGDDIWFDTSEAGFTGTDSVRGGEGNDTLKSGAGDDTLTGDGGADTFIFTGATGQREITDFDPAEDSLLIQIGGMTIEDFALNETSDGLLLSWTGGNVSLTGLSEGDMALSDILFDLG
ncbi:MAG: hypothetical protein OQK00_01575 [Rhodobacteraceae bacterium]|nr:hypothetical protein [Paracoccaceae bacterium]